MTRWAIVADLERCVGCQTCTAACRHANATAPAVQWRKVLDIESGVFPNVTRTFVPVGCQHCADPPCMHVCPTTATRQRPDGIVTIDYDLCIGCAYCDVACPYQARFKIDRPRFAYGGDAIQNEIEREDPRRLGVAQKCTFCSDRIDFGLANGLTPGLEPRSTPACVNACIATALHFGDLDDPDSNVSQLLREQNSFRMHEELGTEPGFHYVYSRAGDQDPLSVAPVTDPFQAGQTRTRGVEPSHQQHWDWKAASNFVCGGAGAGLFVIAAPVSLLKGPTFLVSWAAIGIVALGLFLLLFKIGHPERSLYVLRQPRRSWMSREAWVAGVFFPLATLATWFASPGLTVASAVAALLFLFSQAMILKEARGIPAWRVQAIVPLIVSTGFAEGAGLFLAATTVLPALKSMSEPAAIASVLLAAVRSWTWQSYRTALAIEGAPIRALAELDRYRPIFFVVGLALPVLLTVAGFIATLIQPFVFAAAGACVLVAGSALKFILITRAGFNQGFALKHTPIRGAGAPGPAVKPGWSKV
jgi:phenylacetyl-CoA:acceptor oxidoreductase subunit 1